MAQTLLAIGAHYDDCVFGVPGLLLKAARKGWRVIILTLIGDYSTFAPVAQSSRPHERSEALKDGCTTICAGYGVEMRFLDFTGHRFGTSVEEQAVVARAVAAVRPDVAVLLWPHDRHGDHGPAARLSEVALRHAGALLGDPAYRPPRRLYAYDNGPRHTIGFEPDTYIDITEEWPVAREWLGRFMYLAYGPRPTTNSGNTSEISDAPHPAVALKETIAAYRGRACGVFYAEALRALDAYPQEIV